MAGYIGTRVAVPETRVESKSVQNITATTTSLTGLSYTPTQVEVFHNGVRLVDGTDFTATNGTSITLTTAAQNGDQVVVLSSDSLNVANVVPATGGTFSGNVTFSNDVTVSGNTTFSGTVTGIQSGAGYFQGENGITGDTTNGLGDIFRSHEQTLNTNVTIAGTSNSLAAGPLTVASGVTLTVASGGSLAIV
jgi:hypothetical protein